MRIGIPKDKASPADVSAITLNNVYYHPNMNFSLISQALMCEMGFKFIYDVLGCSVYRNNACIGHIKLNRNLYMIRNAYSLSLSNGLSIYELHRRLGHISYDYLKRLLKTSPNIITQRITDFEEK